MAMLAVLRPYLFGMIYSEMQQDPDYNTRKITSVLNSLEPGIPLNTFFSLPPGDCRLVISNTTVAYFGRSDKGDRFSIRQRIRLGFDVEPAEFRCSETSKEILMEFDGSVVRFS